MNEQFPTISGSPRSKNKNNDRRDGTRSQSVPPPSTIVTKVKTINDKTINDKTKQKMTFRWRLFLFNMCMIGLGVFLIVWAQQQRITVNKLQSQLKSNHNNMDLRKRYTSLCCNNTRFGQTNDCNADGQCYEYLEAWLSWNFLDCCYEVRPIGSKNFSTYCVYSCLDTY